MVKYARIPTKNAQGAEGFRYTKDGKMTKESRIPHEVMEKFQFAPETLYDDMPERRRCLACEAPQSRQRYLNGETVELCEYHYQNMRLGQIAALVRLLKEEEIKNGDDSTPQTKRKRKQQRFNKPQPKVT